MILHTGQHYDHGMSEVFFTEMGIPAPKYNLGVGGGPQGAMTGKQLEGIEKILLDEKPDCLLVYGDTNSTLAGALAAAKLHIPVAHVESGLRSYNRRMPEEVNRVLTDHMSTFLFTPSEQAQVNLAAEGITEGVHFVGDIMYDAAQTYAKRVAETGSAVFDDLGLTNGGFRLATVHRQENTDHPERLLAILEALRRLSADRPLVLPLHPRLRNILKSNGTYKEMTRGLTVIEPVGFMDMIALTKGASLVLTDSGGLQKEAYFHGNPVVVMRDETEWAELIDLGWAQLCPPVAAMDIIAAATSMENATGDKQAEPYGVGNAADLILAKLKALL
jgi:UDP-GlcNAc3NAcA epimerase